MDVPPPLTTDEVGLTQQAPASALAPVARRGRATWLHARIFTSQTTSFLSALAAY